MKVLILNAGSSSLKFKLYDMGAGEQVLAEGNCQRVGLDTSDIKYVGRNGEKRQLALPLKNHMDALRESLKLLTEGEDRVLDSIHEIGAVGHRIAMGGANYVRSVRVSEEMIRVVEDVGDVTPLHTPPQVNTIRACQELLGKDYPMVCGFDTAFHQTMPPEAYMYPIPYELYEKHRIRRMGFHGLSHQYVVERYKELTGKNLMGTCIATCHLGGGSSVTAVKDGASIDNSFGFSSGQGVMCGSRCGTFDHSAIGYIMKKENLSYEEVESMLNRQSGLLGVSGISSDELEVENAALQGNERAKLTMDMMARQLKNYIGGYAFTMGGLDTIIFTGGIGENSDYTRKLICQGLEGFGVKLDEEANVAFNRREYKISQPDSRVDIWIIPTNEELVIARDTYAIVSGNDKN